MVRALLYVSRNLIHYPDTDGDIEKLVAVSRSRNKSLDLTGALISTEGNFAQILEGPSSSVTQVMESILRDPRHTDIVIVSDHAQSQRRFANWAMAYSGRAAYVQQLLKPLTSPPDETTEALERRLIQFMQEFSVG